MKVALYKNGPIAVDIDAAHESLSFYRFEIFTKKTKLYKYIKNLILTALAFGMMKAALQLFWIMLSWLLAGDQRMAQTTGLSKTLGQPIGEMKDMSRLP